MITNLLPPPPLPIIFFAGCGMSGRTPGPNAYDNDDFEYECGLIMTKYHDFCDDNDDDSDTKYCLHPGTCS